MGKKRLTEEQRLKRKEEKKEYHKQWCEANKERLCAKRSARALAKYNSLSDAEKKESYRRHYAWSKNVPWVRTYRSITNRVRSNEFYIKKGIRRRITPKELKILWFRDKGYEMKNPSIDRKDNNADYTFQNCRYIELKHNMGRRRMGRKIVHVQTLYGIEKMIFRRAHKQEKKNAS
jgi:hypothetical protein